MVSISEPASDGATSLHDLHTWKPLDCMDPESDEKIAFIKLNTPITNLSVFQMIWKKAELKAVVDGGVNQLYEELDLDREKYRPDLITGDFDSAKPNLLQYFRDQGVEVIHTPDQNETDFTKCLRIVCGRIETCHSQVDSIVAHVSFDGRFDHVMGNINALYEAQKFTDLPVYLMMYNSVTFLLCKGHHQIHVDSPLRGQNCGLVPIGRPAGNVTTTGLEYNLDHQAMEFGGLISTSNHFDGSAVVTVETDVPLLYTMEWERSEANPVPRH